MYSAQVDAVKQDLPLAWMVKGTRNEALIQSVSLPVLTIRADSFSRAECEVKVCKDAQISSWSRRRKHTRIEAAQDWALVPVCSNWLNSDMRLHFRQKRNNQRRKSWSSKLAADREALDIAHGLHHRDGEQGEIADGITALNGPIDAEEIGGVITELANDCQQTSPRITVVD